MQLARQQADAKERLEKAHAVHQEELDKRTSRLSKSLKTREMEYSRLESMHLAVKAELEQRVQDLEVRVERGKEKLKQAEQRRALDAEGFTNDVSLLRRQLSAVDRKLHQMRLQSRLEDDERLHTLLMKLEKKGARPHDQVLCPCTTSRCNRSASLCACFKLKLCCLQNRAQLNVPRSTAGAIESLDEIKQHISQLERRAQREVLKPIRDRSSC
jgi:predicted ATP-binding protein involved in virulence